MKINTVQPQYFNIIKPVLRQKPKVSFAASSDSVTFSTTPTALKTQGEMPNDIKLETILSMSENSNTPGVLDVINTGYLAQVFKYKPPGSENIYAIKKVWNEDQTKCITANPVEQLCTEAEVYKRLKDKGINIPVFYYYQGDFSGKKGSANNNFIVMEWLDGKFVSEEGTFYNFDLIDKSKIRDVFNLIDKFDENGVFHNDLWSANILFNGKGAYAIDFNRAGFFDPKRDFQGTNLDSFKERFLWRYYSDIYHRSAEDRQTREKNLIDIYRYCLELESGLLNNRANLVSSDNGKAEILLAKAKELNKLTKNTSALTNRAYKEIYDTDLRCGRIYSKYFEFKDIEAKLSFERAKIIRQNHPDILPDEVRMLDANISVVEKLHDIMAYHDETKIETNLQLFKEMRVTLDDADAYCEREKQELYYKKFSKFCDINIKFLEALQKGNKEAAKSVLEQPDNKQFFKETKMMHPYYNDLLKLVV